jgi:oligopeptide/dipeptide ABC transporter ATP-binding protein
MVFQNAGGALHPRMTVGRNILDPLIARGRGTAGERARVLGRLLEQVGLSPSEAERLPQELSGGQQQRVALARALATGPALVVLDEVVSALDVSVQAQVLKLLGDLRDASGTAYVFISHNLAAVGAVSTRVAVMYLGALVEEGPVDRVYASPEHPYTKALLGSALSLPRTLEERGLPEPLVGEIPSPLRRPSGCPFHPRCPMAQDVCRVEEPETREVGPLHVAACHFAGVC